jgi:hypothetical protein
LELRLKQKQDAEAKDRQISEKVSRNSELAKMRIKQREDQVRKKNHDSMMRAKEVDMINQMNQQERNHQKK